MFFQVIEKSQLERFVVIDLDETLIYYREKKLASRPFYTKIDAIVTLRPYIEEFFIKLHSLNFKLVLFTLGSASYTRYILKNHLVAVKNLFILILSWKHALTSYRRYGKYKHSSYVKEMLKQKAKCQLLAIDDCAKINMDKTGYEKRYEIKPFKGDPKDNSLLKVFNKIKSYA